MPWRSEHKLFCSVCGRARAEGETFSRRGKCDACGPAMVIVNATQLHEQRGDLYDHWVRRSYMATRRRLLDVQRASTQTAGD
jgi:hypothetical protein